MIATPKTYYWLKLKSDFFTSRVEIKKLWKQAGGDKYIIIYLRLLLLSLPTDGYIYYEGIEKDLAAELALLLDLYPDDAGFVVAYLLKTGLMLKISDSEYFLPQSIEMLGKECDSAERVRKYREKKSEALQCNNNVTQKAEKIPKKRNNVTERREEKEIEIEIELEEREKEKTPAPAYGEYKNVILTEEEYEKLKTEFPDSYEAKINRLSEYMRQTGKTYKDHCATIRSWAKEDADKTSRDGTMPSSFDTDDFFNAAVMRSYGGDDPCGK